MKKILCLLLSLTFTTVSYGGSYILMDMDSNRVLEGSNIHTRYLTASIAKTMTAYVAIMEGELNDLVQIDYETTTQEGSSIYLKENEEVTVEDLLYGLMLRSGNDAAYALAKHIGGSVDGFVFLMNEYTKIIGMKNSTFENPSGLDGESKNYSTPYDMALLMSKACQNETFKKITSTKVYKNGDKLYVNKHRLVKQGEPYNGGKTGYTEDAGRTLITTASKNDLNLVVVTFKDSDDWNTHRSLFSKGFNEYSKRIILEKQKFKNEIIGDFLPYLDEDISCAVKKNEKFSFEIVIAHNSNYFEGNINIYVDDKLALSRELKGYNVIEMSENND